MSFRTTYHGYNRRQRRKVTVEFAARGCGARSRPPKSSVLGEAALVCRRSIDGRYRRLVEAQGHGQLSAVMGQMIKHAVANHQVPRTLAYHVAADNKLPGSQQVIIGCLGQCGTGLGQTGIEGGEQFAARTPFEG